MSIYAGDDLAFNTLGNDINCLYYYYLNKSLGNDEILGYASTIQTVCYNPFIETTDISIVESNFNTDKYGKPNNAIPKVYRITTNPTIEKTLFEKTCEFNMNEDILNFYPYRYYMLYDGFNAPMIIKPQYLPLKDGKPFLRIKVKTNINQNSKYLLYVEGYKKDLTGELEGIVNEYPMLAPLSSSAYSQFWATSSASFNQSFINNSIENQLNYSQKSDSLSLQYQQNNMQNLFSGISGTLGALTNLLTGNIGGALGGALGTAANAYLNNRFNNENYSLGSSQLQELKDNNDYMNEANRLATLTDMMKTPRAVKSLGNDFSFNKMKMNNRIKLYEFRANDMCLTNLDRFYHKYGYIINRYESNFKIGSIREHFNYVKMGYCELISDSIPKNDLDFIKAIFERGLTFWNVENRDVTIGDYSLENKEVN